MGWDGWKCEDARRRRVRLNRWCRSQLRRGNLFDGWDIWGICGLRHDCRVMRLAANLSDALNKGMYERIRTRSKVSTGPDRILRKASKARGALDRHQSPSRNQSGHRWSRCRKQDQTRGIRMNKMRLGKPMKSWTRRGGYGRRGRMAHRTYRPGYTAQARPCRRRHLGL